MCGPNAASSREAGKGAPSSRHVDKLTAAPGCTVLPSACAMDNPAWGASQIREDAGGLPGRQSEKRALAV